MQQKMRVNQPLSGIPCRADEMGSPQNSAYVYMYNVHVHVHDITLYQEYITPPGGYVLLIVHVHCACYEVMTSGL